MTSTEEHKEVEVLGSDDVPPSHVVRDERILPAYLGLNLRLLLQTNLISNLFLILKSFSL